MPKYMLIMRGTDESNAAMMANIDESMATTGKFIEEMIEAGVLLAAEGLDDPARGVVVHFTGEGPVVTDGPYGETKEVLAGYWVVDCASLDRVTEIAARITKCPGPEGLTEYPIVIRPVMENAGDV